MIARTDHILEPDFEPMTPSERLSEIAEILGRGYLRLTEKWYDVFGEEPRSSRRTFLWKCIMQLLIERIDCHGGESPTRHICFGDGAGKLDIRFHEAGIKTLVRELQKVNRP